MIEKEISRNVHVEIIPTNIGGEVTDTQIKVNGIFWIAGNQRSEFLEKLTALIEQYRI